eukprot:758389-Amphidinium_carterae.1
MHVPAGCELDEVHMAFMPRLWGQLLTQHHSLAWGFCSNSSYFAEAVALAEALCWCLQAQLQSITVISDCEAAITVTSITSLSEPHCESLLVERVRLLLGSLRKICQVTFCHCNGHQDIWANDMVDSLAKKGCHEWANKYRLEQHVRNGSLVVKPTRRRPTISEQQAIWEMSVTECLWTST